LRHGSHGVLVLGMALENGFEFEDGRGKLAQLHVSLGDAFGSLDDFLFHAQLQISLFENFQRLIILRLRLSDDLEHLNRLPQLRLFAWI
jgi:hypothetical protein